MLTLRLRMTQRNENRCPQGKERGETQLENELQERLSSSLRRKSRKLQQGSYQGFPCQTMSEAITNQSRRGPSELWFFDG